MVNFSVEQLREIMGKPDFIRNMSVIAHVDHGKSTLTDSLIARAGIISADAAGKARFTDGRKDEQERGITIKSTGVSMAFNLDGQDYIFNLIDSPGHVDFSSEVTAALRVTDGALVVVDCVEGVCVQTETVLRQAMQERIMPVLMVNKVDRAVLELMLDGETMYRNFVRVIDRVNFVVNTYAQPDMGDATLSPIKGNVAFGSGKDCWGFTLAQFARMYASRFGIEESKMMQRLWGDNFFDPKAKVWRTANIDEDGKVLPRAFVQFIIDPIIKVSKACMEMNQETIGKVVDMMGIKLNAEEQILTGKTLMRAMLKKWINAADALLAMMVHHLPSPKKAQAYRAKYLYEGPEDDACCTGMRNCDPEAPLMMYVSKMVPTSDKGRFYAFGRVFSGTITMGQKVRIMGPNYQPGSNVDLVEKTVQRTVIMMGRTAEFVANVPCGNTVALVGVDQGLIKTGTITSDERAHNIRVMKYSVSPVVRVAVKPKNKAELPKLIAGMQQLAKSDPLVLCINDQETGENIVCGSGELHMEICLKDLVEEYAKIEIVKSDPVVAYRETVQEKSAQAMAKSVSHFNRLYCTAEPLSEELVAAIEDGAISFRDSKDRIKTLTDKFGWDKNDAAKIWAFGPDGDGPNVIVDATSACQFMNEIREHMASGFEIVTKAGVLCDETMRGIRFNVHDTTLHPDSIHRGGGQITPTTRRVLYACELMAKPTLQEPVFRVEITAPQETVGAIYACIAGKRGSVEEEVPIEGTPLTIIKAFLPVSESFGFNSYLRIQTSGKAFPNCVFDHWEILEGDALKPESRLNKLIQTIRVRKGLKELIPDLSGFIDKL
jgi:elongation factor 2